MKSLYSYYRKFENINIWIGERVSAFIGALGILILGMILLQIFLRVFFKFTFSWVFELVSIFAVYAAFFGASLLILKDKFAKVEVLVEIMPMFLQKIFIMLEIMTKIIMGISVLIGSIDYMNILKNYQMTNFQISTRMFAYPVAFFSLVLIWNGFISLLKYIVLEKGRTK